MPERKTLNEDLFYKGSSANPPRLHTCENIKSRSGIKVKFSRHKTLVFLVENLVLKSRSFHKYIKWANSKFANQEVIAFTNLKNLYQ